MNLKICSPEETQNHFYLRLAIVRPVITKLYNDIKNRRYRSHWEEFFEILEFLQRNRKPNVETTQRTTTKGAAQHERMHDYDLEGYNKILEFLQRNTKPNVKSMNTRI